MMSSLAQAEAQENEQNSTSANSSSNSSSSFPLARVKKIMKADKDVNLVSAEAVHLTSIASELFLEFIVKKATDASQTEKRRTILYKDFANVIKADPRLSFLNELIPEPVSVQAALEAQRSRGISNAPPSAPHSPSSVEKRSAEDISSDPGKSKTSSNASSIADFFAKRSATASTEIDIEDQ